MKTRLVTCLFLGSILGGFPASAHRVSAQEARYLSLGLSAGPAVVQLGRRDSSWDFGPVLGGRMEWGNRRSAALLTLDLQPFQAEGTVTTGDFRAVYLLPAVAFGSGGRRMGFGLGLGVFDFQGGMGEEGLTAGFVTGATGSVRITGSYFLELGWKRIQNVKDLRANVWSLQLVKRWRL